MQNCEPECVCQCCQTGCGCHESKRRKSKPEIVNS